MKPLKNIVLLWLFLALLCLAAMPTSAYAQSYTISEEQLTRLDTIFDQWQKTNQKLQVELKLSKSELYNSQMKVIAYQKDLEKLQQDFQGILNELARSKANLQAANYQLQKANESLTMYEKQVQREINSLKTQRTTLAIGLLGVLVFR